MQGFFTASGHAVAGGKSNLSGRVSKDSLVDKVHSAISNEAAIFLTKWFPKSYLLAGNFVDAIMAS